MTELSELIDLMADVPIFRTLTRPHVNALAETARELSFAADQVIFARGEPGPDVFIVAEGRVRLSVLNPEGRVLAFRNALRGDIFGEMAAFDAGVRSADATAMTVVRCYAISSAAVLKTCTVDPAAAHATIAYLCGRLRATSAQVEDIALHSITVRIARFFLQALKMSKSSSGNSKQATLDLRFTQAELADLLGASRQKTNLALSNLTAAKAIARRKGVYTCNVPALKKIARAD